MNKTDLLLQMMEQPQRYTTSEWQEILADEECRELYTLMSKTQSAVSAAHADETITEEMIDGPGLAIRAMEGIYGVGTGVDRAHYPRSYYHQHTHSSGDFDGIVKRKANVHIPIISHRGQEQCFCTC